MGMMMSQVIATFSNFSLNSGKIIQSGEVAGGMSYTSIPLRAYSSATMIKQSSPLFILLSISSLIGAVYLIYSGFGFFDFSIYENNGNTPNLWMLKNVFSLAGLAVVAAVYFVYRYFKSRRASLEIETIGGKQFSAVVSGDHDGVEEFIEAIEQQYALQFDLEALEQQSYLDESENL